MKWKSRLSLILLFMSCVPLGGAMWALTQRIDFTSRTQFEASSQARVQGLSARFHEAGLRLAQALEKMSGDRVLKDHIITPLSHERFWNDKARQRAAMADAERWIKTSPAIDTLRLVDLELGGRIIAMGHRRGVETDDALVLALAGQSEQQPIFRKERIEDASDGSSQSVWTMQRFQVVDGRVGLVAGIVLDDPFMRSTVGVQSDGVASLLRTADGGTVIASSAGERPPWAANDDVVVSSPLLNPRATSPVLTLEMRVSRITQRTVLRDLWQTAAVSWGGIRQGMLSLLACCTF